MPTELVINAASHETRIALIENGTIAELHIERTRGRGIVGNIYKGRVLRVLPACRPHSSTTAWKKPPFSTSRGIRHGRGI
jgi:hypothetical protein